MSITADGNTREGALGRAHSSADVGIPTAMIEQSRSLSHDKAEKPLQRSFGDSSPVALGGFLLCATPASLSLLEFQGAGGFAAAANVGAYLGLGSLLLVLGGIGEWIVGKRMTTAGSAETDFLGNTFYSSVFCLFGGFWLTFGITINPSSGAYGMYSTTGNPVGGLDNPQFYATFSFFLVSMAILCAIFTIASIRTNLVFFLMLVLLTACFGCLAGSFFAVAHERPNAILLEKAGAGLLFAASLLGWYMWASLILSSVDFPVRMPVGDFSAALRGKDN